MDDKIKYEGLFVKYFLGEANKDEKVYVEDWINLNDQNRQYFNKVREIWNLAKSKSSVDAIDLDYEWIHFKKSISSSRAKVVSIQKHLLHETIEIKSNQKPGISNIILKASIAASILFIIGFSWKILSKSNLGSVPIVGVNNLDDKTKATLLGSVRHQKNISGKPQQLVLNEGSVVILSGRSEVSYNEPFSNKRDIHLKGMANFIVAKDKIMPFTVFSGAISTTALGTEFSVNAYANNKGIVIRLYQGKVVVKSINNTNKKMKAGVYLSPGQELIYNNKTGIAKVRIFLASKSNTKKTIKKSSLRDNPSIPPNQKVSWYMFNNQSLSDVFEQLKEMYKIEIVYSESDIKKIYFIGKFDRSESVESILNQICFLNNLKVTKENNRFIVSK